MNWIKKKILLAIKTITFEGLLYNTLEVLWNTLHKLYNSAIDHTINPPFLEELPICSPIKWPCFTKQELRNIIAKYSLSSIPGPDHISWRHFCLLIANNICLTKIFDIANSWITLEHWPSHFKNITSVIIPKPNKVAYNSPKDFHSIVLLNTMGKLLERVISNWPQFHTTANNFLDANQLGDIQQKSIIKATLYLIYLICTGWLKQCHTSIIVFDMAQFFLSLNYSFLFKCLTKADLNTNIINFFHSYYLVLQKVTYCLWLGWRYIQKGLISKVQIVTKDVVKSEV